MRVNRVPQRSMRTTSAHHTVMTPAMGSRASLAATVQRKDLPDDKKHPGEDDVTVPINDDSLFTKKANDPGDEDGSGGLFSKDDKDDKDKVKGDLDNTVSHVESGQGSPRSIGRSSSGSVNSEFKTMMGDYDGYDANSNSSDTKPAKNDTGIPHTPSGAHI